MALIEEYEDRQEMLGCPWCGKRPHEVTRPDWNSVQAGFSFICPTTLCTVRPQTIFFVTREAAKDHWNNRIMRE